MRLSIWPRPINSVKVYGADGNKFGHTNQDGVERFWRHLLGGAAAVRFHRPDSGLGLSPPAVATLEAARKFESLVAVWQLEPANHLLADRAENEAYLAAAPGVAYALYFTAGGGGAVQPDVDTRDERTWRLHWIDIDSGRWGEQLELRTTGPVTLTAPGDGNWLAVLVAGRGDAP